ncbi:hypothetical protein [Micromonospora sp. NBC_01813]|uniref:hypothetical protein n=1 Tax=Micromonospora sp. NBC_01813 TaxID=2975988 RepID=UPI002DDC15E1|nr:hypothetical protein [Micromonospora sp. NBC_01813]WSA11289.1 hypothetical protein OG958_11190 [Micromonospora sp. NBC_01813]
MHPPPSHNPPDPHQQPSYSVPPYSPPPTVVVVEQPTGRAAALGIWTIVFLIVAPIILIILCCVGCFSLGGIGMFGLVDTLPWSTPTPS